MMLTLSMLLLCMAGSRAIALFLFPYPVLKAVIYAALLKTRSLYLIKQPIFI